MQIPRMIRCLSLMLLVIAIPASSFAGVFVSVTVAPPVLPVYTQPPCPGDGYIWTPGYWAYGPDDYYWVPGTWVVAPAPGLLWTPGYWGWGEGVYVWHGGYWGPHIGFYGGVNYGFGYFGTGYGGGYWNRGHFFYNRSVNNVNITNVHIYNKTVINNVTVNRISYNGGSGGIHARPTHAEAMMARERHIEPTHIQMQHEHAARSNRELFASVNHGHPAIAATARPGEFHGRGTVAARPEGAPYRGGENRGVPRPDNSARNVQRPPMSRPDIRSNRGPEQMRSNPRQETRMRNDSAPHSGAPMSRGPVSREPMYRGPVSRGPSPENNRPHESAPHGENSSHGGNGQEHRPH
jgi:hypothetical protein